MPIAPETATTPLRSSRASGSSGTSAQLLVQAADGLGGSAERGSTSFAGAQASFSTETASPPDSQFGLAGADFSIDGLEEMEIYGSGFTGTGASHGRAHRPTVTGANGVVACAHPLAAQAGLA